MLRRSVLLTLGAVALPSTALACAVASPPFDPTKVPRLTLVAVARCTHSVKLPGYESWRAHYRFSKWVRGKADEPVVNFTVQPSDICDYDYEEPKVGADYVLYMHRPDGKLTVGAVLSLAEAKKRDPQFGGRAPSQGARS